MSQIESIHSSLNKQFPLIPSFFTSTMGLFCQTHVFFSTFTQATDFYDNDRENQLEKIFIAAGIQLVGNQFKIVNKTLTVLIISKCALDIMYAYRELTNRWIELKNAVKETFPCIDYASSSDFEKKEQNSVPFIELIKVAIISRIYRIKMIAISLFTLIYQLFKISVYLKDIYLIYHQDENKRFEVLVTLISNHTKYTALFNQQLAEFGDEIDHLVILTSSFLSVFKLNVDKNEVQEILFTLRSEVNQGVQILVEEGKNSLKSIIDPYVLKAPSIELINPNAFMNFIPDDCLPITPEFTGNSCIKNVVKEEKEKESITLITKIFKYLNIN